MRVPLFGVVCPVMLLAACSDAQDQVEDRIEEQAEASAEAAGPTEVALGMSERELLDAEIRASDGTELGDVEAVLRDAAGEVDRLLVEVEDSDPDRYVEVPLDGLSPTGEGDDRDLSTSMTMADIEALPDASIETL